MRIHKVVGRHASTRKYDILTVLATYALAQDKHMQKRVLRFISLLTARYNWQRDELCVGQNEMARMWSVDVRTVKRELSKFRSLGWLVEKRAGARGRITVYGIDVAVIFADTRSDWEKVGADLVQRLSDERITAAETGNQNDNVVPLQRHQAQDFGDDFWGQYQKELYRISPNVVEVWLKNAQLVGCENGVMTLLVQSRFIRDYICSNLEERLLSVARRLDPSIVRLKIED